jgi:hypothetical protein
MKKRPSRKKAVAAGELSEEYRFDYGASRPNRFASRLTEGSVAVVLDADVAAYFRSAEVVNDLLRSVIAALTRSAERPAKR